MGCVFALPATDCSSFELGIGARNKISSHRIGTIECGYLESFFCRVRSHRKIHGISSTRGILGDAKPNVIIND